MRVHSTVEAADCPAAEQVLLTIGRAGVLSCRAIAIGELETVLRLLGPPLERQRRDAEGGTDIVLVEDGTLDITGLVRARCSPTPPMRWRAMSEYVDENRGGRARPPTGRHLRANGDQPNPSGAHSCTGLTQTTPRALRLKAPPVWLEALRG